MKIKCRSKIKELGLKSFFMPKIITLSRTMTYNRREVIRNKKHYLKRKQNERGNIDKKRERHKEREKKIVKKREQEEK